MLPQDGVEAVNLTQTGEVFGSPLYMSPEQCKGERLDARSDIYSMGCLMYETLTGRPATSGDNTMEVLYNHIHEIPAPMKAPLTHVPPQLERIVFKTLAKDPTQRYQSMGELRDDLKAFSLHRKTSVLNRLTDYWQLFCLRRKPRTKRDKIIVAIAVSGFLCATFFAFQLASLYWAAADSPASKTSIVWDEDREAQKINKEVVEDDKARMDVMLHTRVAASMDDKHADPTELINYLSGPAEYLAKRHLWKSALDMYELAYKYSLKYNDYLVLRTMTLRLSMAECYMNLHQYEEAARIVDEMKLRLYKGYRQDYVDHSILAAKLGGIYYMQGKWRPALQEMDVAFKIWTEKHTSTLPFTFYNLPGNPETSYDFTLLISRMATAYQRIYQASVADRTPNLAALQNSVRLYKMAGDQWNHLVGGHDSNRNVTVALANYVFLAHILDKNTDLDTEYADVAKRAKEFGEDSSYEAVILLNYSGYLMDKGRYLDALTNRIQAWKIFAQLAKSAGSASTNTDSESAGHSAPVVGK
ncbi:MAG: protein kinase [Candidatus Melainabacteria bacterium]|nr:protein kinase [Candidatus Melainabacteria bacterium]